MISGAMSVAPIYRLINQWQCSIGIDEGDLKSSDAHNDIIKILNCGFEKDKPVMRCNQNDANIVEFHQTFCPKLITSRYTFDDKALESRCITENMEETERDDIIPVLNKAFFASEKKLRNKLLQFRIENLHKIDADYGETVDLGNISPRLKQSAQSFAEILRKFPEDFKEFKAFLTDYHCEMIEERANSYDGMIILAFLAIIEEARLSNQEVGAITASDVRFKYKQLYNPKDDAIPSASEIGKKLKSVNITSKSERVSGAVKRSLVYNNKTLLKIRRRYTFVEENKEVSQTP